MAVSLPSAPEGEDRMTSFTTVQTAAMQRALRAAASPDTPPGPNPRAPLSEEVKENGVLKTAYMVLWEVAMLPVALSISLSVEPGMI